MPLQHPQGYGGMLVVDVVVIAVCRTLEACMVLSGTIKPSPQGEGFQVRSSSGPLGPVSEVHNAFSNRDLLSTLEVWWFE